MGKKPKIKKSPAYAKQPRIDPSLKMDDTGHPVWQTGIIDLDGPWGWKNVKSGQIFFDNILPKIQNFESMSWRKILNRNNHEVKVSQIDKDAQKRLAGLSLDDFETLVSLRLTGAQRLWGVKINNVFKILWWDPEHKVFPAQKKHT